MLHRQVHLHRDPAMESLVEDGDIVLLCPRELSMRALTDLLTQRHPSLHWWQLYYHLRNAIQV
jgi:hypothetical protein